MEALIVIVAFAVFIHWKWTRKDNRVHVRAVINRRKGW
jgi:hypothetical protein